MDERHLRQVIAILRHGSLRRAAQALGVTQPTLSKSLARLEDELGVTLFDRSGSGARATPIGRYIADRAARMVEDSDRLQREVALLASGEAGEARIGFGPAMRPVFMPNFAEVVALKHPRLRLRLMSEGRPYLLAALLAGQLDIIVVADGDGLGDDDLVRTEVMRDPLVAVAGKSHPLARQGTVSLAEFARHASISQPPASRFGTAQLMGLSGDDAERANFYVINDFATILRLVNRGLATHVGFKTHLDPAIAAGQVVRLDLEWSADVRIVAVMTRAATHSPLLRQIVVEAQTVGAGLGASA